MLFLRDTPVDVLRYLPDFLAEDKTFKTIQDALSWEHEWLRLKLAGMADQLFIPTAGEKGISSWEKVIGIIPKPGENLEARRQEVLFWLQNPESVTEFFLTNLINRYVADEAASIVDIPAEYRIEILYHGGQVTDYTGLHKAIRTYMPAHIGWKLITYTAGMLYLHAAGVVQDVRRTDVDMAADYAFEADDLAMHYAGRVIHNYRYTFIKGEI